MTPAPCEERGADLFALARGAAVPAEAALHARSCEGCAKELERLRDLAADLPAASAGLAPRPSTREFLLRAAASAPPALPPPPRLLRGGRRPPVWIPVSVAAAGLLATVLVLSRPRPGPHVEPTSGAVSVTPLWDGASLDGAFPGSLQAGAELSSSKVASVRLGPPLDADAVLGEGTRLRIPPGEGTARALELLEGAVYLDAAPGAGPLLLRAGGVEVECRGARFSAERRAGGALSVVVESGSAAVRAAGTEVRATGPGRVDVPASGPPAEPLPAEPTDATGWFAYPVLTLELRPSLTPGAQDLVLTLLPSVPRSVRIAPWERFDPLFTLRALDPVRGLRTIPVGAGLLRRPPPEAESDGSFLLESSRPYTIHVDPGALGLPPGKVRLEAVYAAGRPGGLWRGTRASKAMEFEVPK